MKPHEFWQRIEPETAAFGPPYSDRFPARLPGGRVLFLPIRPLGDTGRGIASLILNQASFGVESALADTLATDLRAFDPEIVVGLPTLGLSLARAVAERLGHERFVALGTSHKFWYDAELSVPLTSVTSPDATKRLFLDPRLQPLLAGRRVALVDDVMSTGASMSASIDLLDRIGLRPTVIGAAMLQTTRWEDRFRNTYPHLAGRVCGVFRTPLLTRSEEGWREATDEDAGLEGRLPGVR